MKRLASLLLSLALALATGPVATQPKAPSAASATAAKAASAPAKAPAAVPAATAPPPKASALVPAPAVAARQYLLVDLSSQQVLAESGADVQAEPASLTKLMTAYLVFNALRDKKLTLEQTLPVSARAWNERGQGGAPPGAAPAAAKAGKPVKPAAPGKGAGAKKGQAAKPAGNAAAVRSSASLMFIDPTMKPRVDELLHGLIVQSGNDAAVALAEGVAGSVEAFVEAMNRQAEAWAMKNTRFRNVTGLTEAGHYSSARDVALVAAKIIAEHPTLFAIYSVKSYTFNGIKQDNRNRLLGRDPSVDGMKTGRTDAAGWCLVVTAAREAPPLAGKRRLLSVVLGAASDAARADESQKLLDWGFSAWEAVRIFEPQQVLATVPVWKGQAREVRLGLGAGSTSPMAAAGSTAAASGLVVTVPKGEGARLKSTLTRADPLVAPLTNGQAVGTVKVTTGAGVPVIDVPLVALQEVPLAGWLGRSWDALRLLMR